MVHGVDDIGGCQSSENEVRYQSGGRNLQAVNHFLNSESNQFINLIKGVASKVSIPFLHLGYQPILELNLLN